MDFTVAELERLFAMWRADVDSVPFAHGGAVMAAALGWADRQRYLTGVKRIIDAANVTRSA